MFISRQPVLRYFAINILVCNLSDVRISGITYNWYWSLCFFPISYTIWIFYIFFLRYELTLMSHRVHLMCRFARTVPPKFHSYFSLTSYMFSQSPVQCGSASPTRAGASSLTRFLDHTQRRTAVGRTPLDEWSVLRRDLYWQHTTITTDKHPWPGHWDRLCVNLLLLKPNPNWKNLKFKKKNFLSKH